MQEAWGFVQVGRWPSGFIFGKRNNRRGYEVMTRPAAAIGRSAERMYWRELHGGRWRALEHFHCYYELSKVKEEQLFLTEKLRPHRRFGLQQ